MFQGMAGFCLGMMVTEISPIFKIGIYTIINIVTPNMF
jgi:hypothetical protein